VTVRGGDPHQFFEDGVQGCGRQNVTQAVGRDNLDRIRRERRRDQVGVEDCDPV